MDKAQFPEAEFAALFEALQESANDPVAFSKLRAKILALNFERTDIALREKLQNQQAQIDAMVAVNGYSQANVRLLIQELSASANRLNSVANSLKNSDP